MSDRRGGFRDSRAPRDERGERDRDRDRGYGRRDSRDWRGRDRDGRDDYGRSERRRSRSRSPRRGGRSERERETRDRREADSRKDYSARDRDDDKREYRRDDRDRNDERRPTRKEEDRDKRNERDEESRSRKPRVEDSSTKLPNVPSGSGPSEPNTAPPPDSKADGEIEEGEDMEEDESQMMAAMGFGGFDSTKGKPVLGNQQGAANVKKQRTWRQYMNRRGGFNRPLDKVK